MRRNDNNLTGYDLNSAYNAKHVGCLRNADYFIDNYFKDYLKDVPDIFFNFNYRKKYLMLERNNGVTSYNVEDFAKFSGKRVHFVRDWLNDRLHLLDLYFNLGNITDPILTCKIDEFNEEGIPISGTWSHVEGADKIREYPTV
jgi:hypothetical protein